MHIEFFFALEPEKLPMAGFLYVFRHLNFESVKICLQKGKIGIDFIYYIMYNIKELSIYR